MSTIIATGRNNSKTGNLTDCEIAQKFYDDFDVENRFGDLVSNIEFNTWIRKHNFENMTHGWATRNENNAWNHHRNTIRNYIKNGVMTNEYARLGLKPFCLEVKEHGQSLIITRFVDVVIDNFNTLASKRQKNIKNQDKVLKKDFKALTEIYQVKRIDAIMQNNIIEAQNKMRLAFEKSCGEILTDTVRSTMASIAESKKAVKEIARSLFDYNDSDENDQAA